MHACAPNLTSSRLTPSHPTSPHHAPGQDQGGLNARRSSAYHVAVSAAVSAMESVGVDVDIDVDKDKDGQGGSGGGGQGEGEGGAGAGIGGGGGGGSGGAGDGDNVGMSRLDPHLLIEVINAGMVSDEVIGVSRIPLTGKKEQREGREKGCNAHARASTYAHTHTRARARART